MTDKVRMKVTLVMFYMADPEDYPDQNPIAMAKYDQENIDVVEIMEFSKLEDYKIEPVNSNEDV